MVASTLTVGAARSNEILRKFPSLICRRFPQVGVLAADAEPAFCDVGFLRFLTEALSGEKGAKSATWQTTESVGFAQTAYFNKGGGGRCG